MGRHPSAARVDEQMRDLLVQTTILCCTSVRGRRDLFGSDLFADRSYRVLALTNPFRGTGLLKRQRVACGHLMLEGFHALSSEESDAADPRSLRGGDSRATAPESRNVLSRCSRAGSRPSGRA